MSPYQCLSRLVIDFGKLDLAMGSGVHISSQSEPFLAATQELTGAKNFYSAEAQLLSCFFYAEPKTPVLSRTDVENDQGETARRVRCAALLRFMAWKEDILMGDFSPFRRPRDFFLYSTSSACLE